MSKTGAHQAKQTLFEKPALVALGRDVRLLPHHTKAFRWSHVIILTVIVVIVALLLVEAGTLIGQRPTNQGVSIMPSEASENTTVFVKSGLGFSLNYDSNQFNSSVNGDGLNGSVSEADLKKGANLQDVLLSPLPSRVPASEMATELELKVEPDGGAYATFLSKAPKEQDNIVTMADYFAPKPTASAKIALESRAPDSLGGSDMTKSVYLITPTFAGNPTRTITWTGEVEGRPFAIMIRGIVGEAKIPSSMSSTITSLSINSPKSVKGVSSILPKKVQTYDQKHIADLVSPSVVKVYHIVCGTLVYKGSELSSDICSGTSGSGFVVSSGGYIATNGHVVVYGAKDLLANLLTTNKVLLADYLRTSSMSESQIAEITNRPELTASAVSKVFDLPDSELYFSNQRELNIVSLGDRPLDISSENTTKKVVGSFSDSSYFKRANLVGYDYSPKDQFSVLGEVSKSFTASDVALLKIDGADYPYIPLSSEQVGLNQKITLFGFPTDADNQLTDKSMLAVTATNGSISAIRKDSGGTGKLFQSDVDASHGNSGGPAVNEMGQAIGLLTYRFSTGKTTDSAKSYIRDINDLSKLSDKNNIKLGGVSKIQQSWEKGLSLYSEQRYSKALVEFNKVKDEFPAHKLVGDYIQNSELAIKEGRDNKTPPIALLLIGLGIGVGALVAIVLYMLRHYGKYRVYRTFHAHKLAIRSS